MRKSKGIVGLLSLALAMPLFAAAPAAADCEGMREFRGLIQKYKKSGRKAGFVLDNRMGDKVKFQKAESVEVVDTSSAGKKAEKWEDLKNNMYVGVCWKFTDNPRLAYKVTVQDEPDDGATDE